jgi:hypothetical protein
MTGWRVYPAVLALVALAGCASGTERPVLPPPAEARTLELGWVERYEATRFTLRVERLVLADDGWRAEVSVANGSGSPYRLGEESIALVLLDSASRAELRGLSDDLTRPPPALRPEDVAPAPPPALGPGASWSGTISGPEVLRDGSVVRVLFGPFSRIGARDVTEAADVFWVTDHSVRLGGERAVLAAPAEPRTPELGWIERSTEAGLVFRVDRLAVRSNGWVATLSVTNRSSALYSIQRPHRPGESMFGLVLLRTADKRELRELTADFRKEPPFLEPDRFTPRLPLVLPPGSTWRGTMAGSRVPPRGSVVRVLFGRFLRARGQPRYVLWVTDHSVRL